ncbi:putative MFS multidrug transporter [Aspergillus violaceofuscus CBS 115571]|uniref:Putative MFS multidrug transporter n=1 Tax=Aspergillus violaceofuscus (strain CBS 115571) TaxID=1450538 RepID=A0A2V5GVT6_ASPV1|nr:putative MFS multidrug transporter [Aspergillus violaceofuscus CBS 115571]
MVVTQDPDPERALTDGPTLTRSYTADAEGYTHPNTEPTISKLPSLTNLPEYEVDWEPNDSANPRLWPVWYRGLTVVTMSLGATVVSLSSTLYTSGLPGLEKEFHISRIVGLLGVTTYLCGMGIGTIVFAPLSEIIGRRPVYLFSMTLFLLLILPSALAQNIEAILISRFFGGFFGSAIMGNSPASVNDVVSDEHRAMAFGIWSIGPTNGPVYGPIIGGFVFEYLGWRWTNWLVLIIGGAVLALMACIRETYAPVILRQRAAQRRQQTGDARWWTRYDVGESLCGRLRTGFGRPFVMLFTEPICIFWDIYVALIYGVLYLCFVAFPIAFQTERGWSPGIGGLAFVGIGVGVLIVIACEPLFRRVINLHRKDPATGLVAPEAMASVVCLGATLLAVGQLWFAWTCTPNVHWVVPILSGVPFGAGNACVFIYASNYVARSYGIYTASALAGNMLTRSIVGACLPLAGPSMYATLGLNWASTLLGLVEAACISIPGVFYFYGHRIRKASPMIQELERMQARA